MSLGAKEAIVLNSLRDSDGCFDVNRVRDLLIRLLHSMVEIIKIKKRKNFDTESKTIKVGLYM